MYNFDLYRFSNQLDEDLFQQILAKFTQDEQKSFVEDLQQKILLKANPYFLTFAPEGNLYEVYKALPKEQWQTINQGMLICTDNLGGFAYVSECISQIEQDAGFY